jgi:hypothetical protein
LGLVSAWALPLKLSQMQSTVDLTIARVDRVLARLFFDNSYLTVLDWVGTWLPVPEDAAAYARARNSLWSDRRMVERSKLQTVVSHEDSDFEEFYHSMYLPFAAQRHGKLAMPRDRGPLRRQFHQGGLFWVQRDGQRVAGSAFERSGGTLRLVAIGLAGDDPSLARQGAFAAIYFSAVDYAREHACDKVDLGLSRACLMDGVLRYKRKWGVALIDRQDVNSVLLVRWDKLEGAVAEFLSHSPLISRERGGLSAVHAMDAAEAKRLLWMPGLQSMVHATDVGAGRHAEPPCL